MELPLAASAVRFDSAAIDLGEIDGLLAGHEAEQIIQFALRVADYVCTQAGATPPELSTNPAEFVTAAKAFGRLLYSKYLLPLEIAGFLLLVALVGVVSLSKDNPENQA